MKFYFIKFVGLFLEDQILAVEDLQNQYYVVIYLNFTKFSLVNLNLKFIAWKSLDFHEKLNKNLLNLAEWSGLG